MSDPIIKLVDTAENNPLEQKDKEVKERMDSAEIKENKDKFASSVDAHLEGTETVENVDGNISETSGEDKDIRGDGVQAGSASYDPAVIKANLLKNIPPQEVMREQIRAEIEKEIKYLHNKAMKMARSNASYFEMSNVMKKIRELKGLLLTLAKASLDTLKNLWVRFVHEIM